MLFLLPSHTLTVDNPVWLFSFLLFLHPKLEMISDSTIIQSWGFKRLANSINIQLIITPKFLSG